MAKKFPKIILFVESLVGSGHIRMASLVARELVKEGNDVYLVTGSAKRGALFGYGGAKIIEIPEISEDFASHRSNAPKSLLEERRRAILKAYENIKPSVIILETWPFARGNLFDHEMLGNPVELKPGLLTQAAKEARRPNVYAMLRDIMYMASPGSGGSATGAIGVVRKLCNGGVIVCGDENFVSLEASYPAGKELREQTRYTGYVVDNLPARNCPTDNILVAAGGGFHENSRQLLTNTLEAVPHSGKYQGQPWFFFVPQNDSHHSAETEFVTQFQKRAGEIAKHTGTPIYIERNRADYLDRMVNAELVVNQGGYNSCIEVVCAAARDGTRKITVPISLPFMQGKDEQVLRAQLFANKGLITVVSQTDSNNPALFGKWIAESKKPPQGSVGLNLDGSRTIAETINQDFLSRC
jgi:predicted glycosyltransferase